MSRDASGSLDTEDSAMSFELVSRLDNAKTFNATLTAPDSHDAPVATLSYGAAKEDGKITLCSSNTTFQVSHTSGSGIWKLRASPDWSHSLQAETVARASKNKFWRRNFVITFQDKSFMITPTSTEHRNYEVRSVPPHAKVSGRDVDGVLVGRLNSGPEDSKTYELAFKAEIQTELVVFCFWLVNLMNKRHDTATDTTLVWGA